MSAALLVDLGSTYTKLLAVDLERQTILGRAAAPSTVATDVTLGLLTALDRLHRQLGGEPVYRYRLACSSAAGGLKMVVIGLVPDLTAEAARRAALGAGARVVGVFSHVLGQAEWDRMRQLEPDLVLLAGGTDGGERRTIVANAAGLAALRLGVPVVVAGNKSAADEVLATLQQAGQDARLAHNVMPEIGRLEVEPAREAIRRVFVERITEAKGIKRAEALLDGGVLMPTPTAVLAAARLLSAGVAGEPGLGDLLVVDVGGATTDVHSVASGVPTQGGVLPRGLPEPHAKRSVEGDLGLRHSAPGILAEVGAATLQALVAADAGHAHGAQPAGPGSAERVGPVGVEAEHLGAATHARASRDERQEPVGVEAVNLDAAVRALHAHVERLPTSASEWALDEGLAAAATRVAVRRHAGRLEEVYTPTAPVSVQYGKDLREVPTVVGTGGVLVYGPNPRKVLAEALFDPSDPLSLRPAAPTLFVDGAYCLYAIGLLAEVEPTVAFNVARSYLRRVDTPDPTRHAAATRTRLPASAAERPPESFPAPVNEPFAAAAAW